MQRRHITRRWFVVGSVGFLAAWLPVPIDFRFVNASGEDVRVRFVGGREWIAVQPAADAVHIGTYNFDGLCSPPKRWLPEEFAGLEIELADGSMVVIPRETFEQEAVHDRGWTYRFGGR